MATRETSPPGAAKVSIYRLPLSCLSLVVLVTYSFSNHSLYTLGSELHRNTSRLCIALSITITSLILSPIILSILQPVSYIQVQVDCVLRYE